MNSQVNKSEGRRIEQLRYIEKMPCKDFLKEADPNISESDLKQYCGEIGENLFKFMVRDEHEKRIIIKRKVEVVKFLQWYSKEFNTNLKLQDLEKDKEFNKFQNLREIQKSKQGQEFMELEFQELFKFKAVKVKKMKNAKRWYEIICGYCAHDWEDCTMIITSQGIIETIKNSVTGFLLFTTQFTYESGFDNTMIDFGITMYSCHRQIDIFAENAMDYYSFLYFLRKGYEEARLKQSRFKASSFVRYLNTVDFIVDAEDYFRQVAHALERAKSEIFMCGWWISPELPLIRPVKGNEKYRLDNLLKSKASEGVKVNIVVFNSPPVIPNNSSYTENKLRSLHSNIRILSHPCDLIPGIWTHHQKAVVIDQEIAFMGGLDLCYGRYDSPEHPINSSSQQMYPGIEYNNNRIKDFNNVQQFMVDALPRNKPRMPWHDVALKVQGRVVSDISSHFIEYWNNSFMETFLVSQGAQAELAAHNILQMAINQQEEQKKLKKEQKKGITPNGERSDMAIHPMIEKEQQTENQLLTVIKQKILTKKQQARSNFNKFSKGMNKKLKLAKRDMKGDYLILSFQSLGLIKLNEDSWKQKKKTFKDHCQLLRSASQWSIGLDNDYVERSIQNSYLEIISQAKHHIYIQNQFFISAQGEEGLVQNQIVNALFDRIKKAINQKQKFKVIVVMPLLPGMEGEIDEAPPMALRLVMHWQYQTINRGEKSLYARLRKITPNPENYIEFYGLRQHGILNGKPVTEIIYVHTKLMIVDDKIAICGSANINDRSQKGDGDSELCMIVTEGKKVQKKVNGQNVEVSEKHHNLRVKLFMEHFGFQNPSDCEDPLSQTVIEAIRTRAKNNTEAYRNIFRCYPDDQIKTYKEGLAFKRQADLEQYKKHGPSIKGGVVEFPLLYLENEPLATIEPDILHSVVI